MTDGTATSQTSRHCSEAKTKHRHVDCSGILLSEDVAQNIFDELKSNDDFFWEYSDDGCLARTHKMCAILHAKGIFCEKIRAENAHGTWLSSFGLSILQKENTWLHVKFHMAVAVRVLVSGLIEERIIDPAFFNGPVPVETWLRKLINRDSIQTDGTVDMSKQDKNVTRLPFDVFEKIMFWDHKDQRLKITDKLLQMHRKNFNKEP